MSRIIRSGDSALDQRQALIAIAGDEHLVVVRFEGQPQRFDDFGIVVDEQNPFVTA